MRHPQRGTRRALNHPLVEPTVNPEDSNPDLSSLRPVHCTLRHVCLMLRSSVLCLIYACGVAPLFTCSGHGSEIADGFALISMQVFLHAKVRTHVVGQPSKPLFLLPRLSTWKRLSTWRPIHDVPPLICSCERSGQGSLKIGDGFALILVRVSLHADMGSRAAQPSKLLLLWPRLSTWKRLGTVAPPFA